MSDDLNYLKEADALLLGGSAIEIHPSTEVIHEVDGRLYAVPTEPWIKLSTAFRKKWLGKLKGSNLSVFLAIALHIDDKGEAYPSVETIAKETQYSEREVQRAVSELKDMGLLTVYRGMGINGTNLYTINAMASYGTSSPQTQVGDDLKSPPKVGDDSHVVSQTTPMSPEVEPLSRTINTRKEYLQKIEDRKEQTRQSISKFESRVSIPHLEEYPEDIRPVLEKFFLSFKISIPPIKSSQAGYWIKGARELEIACEGHPEVVIKEIKNEIDRRPARNKITIASPNSLIQMARAKVAELKMQAENRPFIPQAAELWIGGVRYEK